jgi:thiol-disulfide isomerase/thioredoxin
VSYIFLPGTNFTLHLDVLGKDSTNYDDSGRKENDFYRNLLAKSMDQLKAIPQQDPELFFKTWEQQYNAVHELVRNAASSGMSSVYISWISKSLQSLYETKLSRQLVTYVTMTRRWPANMDDYIGKVSLFSIDQFNQPHFFNRETDKEMVESYYLFYSLVQDWKKKVPAPNAEITFRNAINYVLKLKADGARDLMTRYLVTSSTAYTTDTVFLKWMKNVISPARQNNFLVKIIAEKQNVLRDLGKGKQAPHFEATDISGSAFSYKNFQGKYLFIDIWATWCIPCRMEIPYLEALKKKYAGQAVEFISVSMDANVNAWKKFVEPIENKDQFHSNPAKQFCIREVYHAQLIPAFVLIDPQGKIINPTCFRPSDPALGLLIDDLLQKNNSLSTQ